MLFNGFYVLVRGADIGVCGSPGFWVEEAGAAGVAGLCATYGGYKVALEELVLGFVFLK